MAGRKEVRYFLPLCSSRVSIMVPETFGVAVAGEPVDERDELVEKSADLGVRSSKIVEAILTAYLQSDVDHAASV